MNLTLQYLQWQFVERPKEILKAIKNFLSFGAYFFSIKQTIASLFAPWKNITWSAGRGFDIQAILESAFSNLISRIIGFILRIFLIVFFIIYEVLVIIFGIIFLALWILLPLIIIIIFISGIKYV